MEDFIKALNIFMKHGNVTYPFSCEYEVLYIFPASNDFTEEEFKELDDLGFHYNEEDENFYSFKYGSC